MQAAMQIYERVSIEIEKLVCSIKLVWLYQTQRNESHYQRDVYDPLLVLGGLHKKAGTSG